MRVVITGAHSTGKTTLLKALEQIPELKSFEFLDEFTRRLQKLGVVINEDADNITQILTLNVHVENILKKHFISDRCILDALVYTSWLKQNGKVDFWVLDYAERLAEQILKQYDYIFYIPVEIDLVKDGIRSGNSQFRNEIEKLFEFYIRKFNLKVVNVKGSVSQRTQTVLNCIENYSLTVTMYNNISILPQVTTDVFTSDYLQEMYEYGKNSTSGLQLYYFTKGKNRGWAFVRPQGNICHLSRFIIEGKNHGLGSDFIRYLQEHFRIITLWSNVKAIKFYKKNRFVFTDIKSLCGEKQMVYTYGLWDKQLDKKYEELQ